MHVLTFSSVEYAQPVDAVDDAAVSEQVLVAKETQDAPVDAGLEHLISVLTKLDAELLEPVVKVCRVARLVVGDLLQLRQISHESARHTTLTLDVFFPTHETKISLKIKTLFI